MTDSEWWRPARHEGRRPALLARTRIQARIRQWLATEGFTEVDPCALAISPGNEAHLHGFATDAIGPDGAARRLYLATSPEFAMKKLLAAGERRIAAFAHVWRNRERGALHSPEFTMLEWYRAGEGYTALMDDCAALMQVAAKASGTSELRFREATCDPFAAPQRLSVTDAFARAGIDLTATLHDNGATDIAAMTREMRAAGHRVAEDDSWADMFSRVMVAIEPTLGAGRATLLDRYPVAEAALARPCPDDPRFAERFELYACGVELANGFGELTNADEQRRRFTAEMSEMARIYGSAYPLDEDFLAALTIMPEASGIALGFDRLVMLATAAPHIDAVIWAPCP